MDRWEYDVKELYGPWTSPAIEEEEALAATRENLNKLGAEGWELIHVIDAVDRESGITDHFMILRRRLP